MYQLSKIASVLSLIAAVPLQAQALPRDRATPVAGMTSLASGEPSREVVSIDGLVGELYRPSGSAPTYPAVLVLGGSEGGLRASSYEARDLARHGFVALALAYFGSPGLPEQLVGVQTEYFGRAIHLLATDKGVSKGRVAVMGTSKGGEAALLIAANNPQIRAVVAGVPSSVVWQGVDTKDRTNSGGSWTRAGMPVPFVPYDMSKPFTSVHDLYARSLKTLSNHPDAVIPVERINGPVMLICGKEDTLWPSCEMSDAVVERLNTKGFKHPVVKLSYDHAGHAAFGMPIPDGNPAKVMLNALGGDVSGNDAARADSWAQAIAFLHANLAS